MTHPPGTPGPSQSFSRTRKLGAPLRLFLRTEEGSSGVLLAAIVGAMIWANVDPVAYDKLWHTTVSIRAGAVGVDQDLRSWINSGLMTLFFLVVGLEARREADLGELRARRLLVLPVTAGVLGLIVPVAIYLAWNATGTGARGWGTAMSTDTALAMGALALAGRTVTVRLRAFLLPVFVVDDLVALAVIVGAYSGTVHAIPVLIAVVGLALLIAAHRTGVARPGLIAVLGLAMWSALLAGGIDPVVTGLAVGLTAPAYTPSRGQLELATGLFRRFREQPTPELARSASAGVASALSLNARLQRVFHPWTSRLIVPLFGLANAGLHVNGAFLVHAYAAPVTLGIIVGYLVGKPVAVIGTSWLVGRLTRGAVRPPVGWAAVAGGGTIAGVGFTVSLLIAPLALRGNDLAEAKLGILSTAVIASVLTWSVLRLANGLSPARRARALLGDAEQLTDLDPSVDPQRDHIRGPDRASVTVVEYGDFQCPFCGRAEVAVRELLRDHDVRFVWRHLPLGDIHPDAPLAAEAAEAAAVQGAFWQMHDLMLSRQRELRTEDLLRYAGELGLDQARFRRDLARHSHAARIAQDVESADLSGVSGTPTFFINGRRHHGAYDIATLTAAIRDARQRAELRILES